MTTQAGELIHVDAVVASDDETLKRSNKSDMVSQQTVFATEGDYDAEKQSKPVESHVTQVFKNFPFRIRGKDVVKVRGDQDKNKNPTKISTKKPSAIPATNQADRKAQTDTKPAKPQKPILG